VGASPFQYFPFSPAISSFFLLLQPIKAEFLLPQPFSLFPDSFLRTRLLSFLERKAPLFFFPHRSCDYPLWTAVPFSFRDFRIFSFSGNLLDSKINSFRRCERSPPLFLLETNGTSSFFSALSFRRVEIPLIIRGSLVFFFPFKLHSPYPPDSF